MKKKVRRKRLNIKRTLFLIIVMYIIIYGINYIINQPIKHILINGNELVKDNEIIELANIKDYPSIFKYTNKNMEEKISKHKLIDSVDVKKTFNFGINITVKENKILFYYLNTKKIVLSNGDIINNNLEKIYGIPTLIDKIDGEILNEFVKSFSFLNENIIFEMNEIEYSPSYSEDGTIISKDRFKILMNDGNTILTNSKNVKVLNKYNDIFASVGDRKGTINLESNKISNLIFIPYEE